MENINQKLMDNKFALEQEHSWFQGENLYFLPESQNSNKLLQKRSIFTSVEYHLMNKVNLTILTENGEWSSFGHFF